MARSFVALWQMKAIALNETMRQCQQFIWSVQSDNPIFDAIKFSSSFGILWIFIAIERDCMTCTHTHTPPPLIEFNLAVSLFL